MARRYGQLNRYNSRIRRCALSGLRGYEKEMIHYRGRWYLPAWVDSDMSTSHRAPKGHIEDTWASAGELSTAALTLKTNYWSVTSS